MAVSRGQKIEDIKKIHKQLLESNGDNKFDCCLGKYI